MCQQIKIEIFQASHTLIKQRTNEQNKSYSFIKLKKSPFGWINIKVELTRFFYECDNLSRISCKLIRNIFFKSGFKGSVNPKSS